MKTYPKTITVLEDGKALLVETVRNEGGGDVTYLMPQGYRASASWKLMFIREALDLCPARLFNEISDMVMPESAEFDWSFVRDADEMTKDAIAERLYRSVGGKMEKMGLTSVAEFRGGK